MRVFGSLMVIWPAIEPGSRLPSSRTAMKAPTAFLWGTYETACWERGGVRGHESWYDGLPRSKLSLKGAHGSDSTTYLKYLHWSNHRRRISTVTVAPSKNARSTERSCPINRTPNRTGDFSVFRASPRMLSRRAQPRHGFPDHGLTARRSFQP